MLNLNKPRYFLFLFSFLLLLLILPTDVVYGNIILDALGTVGDAFGGLLEAGGNALLSGLAAFSGLMIGVIIEVFIGAGQSLLSYVLTSPINSDTEVVTEGWNIVRSLANAALIIGLVIIAINIILGKEEGKAKKTLVNFVIVALLINFTPLLCGFLIEGANVLASSFIGGGLSSSVGQGIIDIQKDVTENLGDKPFYLIANLVITLFFAITYCTICVLYSILFTARIVVLWILIIASPIALATKVFPKSNAVRKFFPSILYWDDWYEMFLTWVIIVIPASLFLHLANISMTELGTNQPISDVSGEGIQAIIEVVIKSLFSYSIPMLILIIGFMITIISGGKVAAPIGNISRSATKKIKGRVKGAAKGAAKGAGRWAKEGAVGAGAATLKKENPFRRPNRDSGRASVDRAKASMGGVVKTTKDYFRTGESNSWAKRSKEAEKQLIGGDMDDLENIAEFNLARQHADNLRASKSLSEKEVHKMYSNLFFAAANNEGIEDDVLEKYLSQSKEKGIDINPGKTLNKMSGKEIMNKCGPSALEREMIAKHIAPTKQGEYILNDNRGTQAHSAALSRGIAKSQETETKTEGAKAIGGNSYAGSVAQINTKEQELARELEGLNKLGDNLTPEQERRKNEISDQLKSLK